MRIIQSYDNKRKQQALLQARDTRIEALQFTLICLLAFIAYTLACFI